MPTIGTNVVVMKDGQVLLTKRSDIPVWCLPGGGVDARESVAQTAVREVLEETGAQVQLTRLEFHEKREEAMGEAAVFTLVQQLTGTPTLARKNGNCKLHYSYSYCGEDGS